MFRHFNNTNFEHFFYKVIKYKGKENPLNSPVLLCAKNAVMASTILCAVSSFLFKKEDILWFPYVDCMDWGGIVMYLMYINTFINVKHLLKRGNDLTGPLRKKTIPTQYSINKLYTIIDYASICQIH